MKSKGIYLAIALALVFSLVGAGLALPGQVPVARAAGGTWYVANSGSDTTGDGSLANPWQTIQFAVSDNLVTDGDTVMVAAGTYDEQVTTGKSLTLRGAQAGVDARGRSGSESTIVAPVTGEDLHALRVSENATLGTTVDGFRFVVSRSGVILNGADITFVNNIVEASSSSTTDGFPALLKVNTPDLTNVTFQYNDISPTAILSADTDAVNVNTIGEDAVILIDSNRIGNASGSGISIGGGDSRAAFTFTNNEVYNNSVDGVHVESSPVCRLGSVTASGNTIHDNSGNGVFFNGNYTVWSGGGIWWNNNNIYGNASYGMENQNAGVVIDAEHNWWGDATGPYHASQNPTGLGDAVSWYIDFYPWDGGGTGSPAVTDVDPISGEPGSTPSVTITGSDFVGATAVSFGADITVDSFAVDNATQITADISISGSAAAGPRDVAVTNASGTGTLSGGFTVTTVLPGPSISSVTPDSGNPGDTLTITIGGANFSGATAVSFGYGITTDGFNVDSASQITANVTIASSTPPGGRQVVVTTPDGTGRLTDGFTVTGLCPPAPPGWYEQFTTENAVGTVYGQQQLYQTFTPVTCHFVEMVSFSVYKWAGNPDYTVTIALHNVDGNHQPMGLALCSTSFDASSLTTTPTWYEYEFLSGYQVLAGIEYAIVLSAGGGNSSNRVGFRTYSIDGYDGGHYGYSPDGGATWVPFSADVAFKEGQLFPPSIEGVSPSQSLPGETVYVFIQGVSFYDVTAVDFGEGITVDSYTVVSGTQITASISISDNASLGVRDVTVTTRLGMSDPYSGFTVVQTPPPAPAGWYEQNTSLTTGPVATVYGQQQLFQTFTASVAHYFDQVSFVLYKYSGNPNYNVTIALHSADGNHQPAGPALCSTSFSAWSLTPETTWYEYGFASGYQLLGTEYAIVLSADGGDINNRVGLGVLTSEDGYSGGQWGYSADGGTTWAGLAGDMAFKEGQMGPPSVTGVAPSQCIQGQTLDVVIAGTFFTGATSVGFGGTGVTVDGYTADSSSQITASITIDAAATPGVRDVIVTTPLGTSDPWGGFTVVQTPPPAPAGWYEQFTTENAVGTVYGQQQLYQTFTPSVSHYLDVVAFSAYKWAGNPNYTVTISLYSVDGNQQPMGSAFCSTSFAASSLTATPTWYEFVFSTGYQLLTGTEYALVVSADGGDSSNRVGFRTYSTDGYDGGHYGYTADGGATWVPFSADMAFKEGQLGPPSVTGMIPSQGIQGQTVGVIITGTFLSGATSVGFSGTGITVDGYTVDSSNQITASITIDAAANPGVRDVTVTTPLGTSDPYGGFTVVQTPPPAPDGWYEQFTIENAVGTVYGQQQLYQTFTPSVSHYLDMVAFSVYKWAGNPNYTVTISLYSVDGNQQPMGSAFCSTTFAASSLTATPTWYDYWFSTGYQLLAGTEYAIVLSANGGDSSNRVGFRTYSIDGYDGGHCGYSVDGGATWVPFTADMAFKEGQMGSPSVSGVIPSQGIQGQTVGVIITGTFLSGATSVGFSGTGITVDGYTVDSSSQITANITIDGAASPGVRDVTVTTPSGTSDPYSGFTVVQTPPPAPDGWYEEFTMDNGVGTVYGQQQLYQTFTPSVSHVLYRVSFSVYRWAGYPNYTVTLSLYSVDGNHRPVGPVLCSTSFSGSALTSTPTWYEYVFANGYPVLAGTEYAIVISANGGDAGNRVGFRTYGSDGYSGGHYGYSADGGATWVPFSADMAFREGQL